MPSVLETPRLLLRPVRPSDAEAFFAFLGDPDAMRFTHHHASLRECRRRLAVFEWRRRSEGYATELAHACLAWADQVLGLPEVRAFAHPGNAASRRVLEKAGFAAVRPVPEMERILYSRPRHQGCGSGCRSRAF